MSNLLRLLTQSLAPLLSGHAARPWLSWILPVALFLALYTMCSAVELLCVCAPWWPAPTPVGLFTLLLVNALATVPLFRWPGPLPSSVLCVVTLQAATYLQYLSTVNVFVLGRAVGLWVGVPNVAVLVWIATEATAALPNPAALPDYRLRLFGHYAYTLPVVTLPQVALVGCTTLLFADPWMNAVAVGDGIAI
jgi:hypothetical protein